MASPIDAVPAAQSTPYGASCETVTDCAAVAKVMPDWLDIQTVPVKHDRIARRALLAGPFAKRQYAGYSGLASSDEPPIAQL